MIVLWNRRPHDLGRNPLFPLVFPSHTYLPYLGDSSTLAAPIISTSDKMTNTTGDGTDFRVGVPAPLIILFSSLFLFLAVSRVLFIASSSTQNTLQDATQDEIDTHPNHSLFCPHRSSPSPLSSRALGQRLSNTRQPYAHPFLVSLCILTPLVFLPHHPKLPSRRYYTKLSKSTKVARMYLRPPTR